MARKNFVLDTNVLLHDPRAIYHFADNTVVIPIYVLEEIDSFKKDQSDLGRNAREISRQLDACRRLGRLSEGVPIGKGGLLRVAIGKRALPDPLRAAQIADNFILAVALEVRDAEPNVRTFLVTKDVNLRVRGDALGLSTLDYDAEKIDIHELYAGTRELEVPAATVDAFYQDGSAPIEASDLRANEYLLLKDESNAGHTALARYDLAQKRAMPVKKLREGVWGIRPKNKEQHYALDLLLNDDVKLVTLVGKAGTGKTLLAIAAGMQKVVEESAYIKLLVSRPVYPLGRDIGFLPGDIEEKLNPWMQPIYDNVEFLLGFNKDGKDKKNGQNRSYAEMMELGYVEIEPLTYIRGRSIPNQYMIVDEAQNLTPHEVKTIITRVGDGTKIVLTGDPYQIDNPYVDAGNNGLTTVVERFKNEPIAGHVTLTRGERSALAELASNIL